MRQRWTPEPRGDLGHSRTAAHPVGAFEDERLQASLREKRRRDETVETGTDDDDVEAHGVLAAIPFQNPQRGVATGSSHDATAGMRRRAAHPKVSDRRRVL